MKPLKHVKYERIRGCATTKSTKSTKMSKFKQNSFFIEGMFGVKLDSERSKIESLTKAMIRTGTEFKKEMESDQYLLDLIFWPTVKDDAVHSFY